MKTFRHFFIVTILLGLSIQAFANQEIEMSYTEACDNYYIQPGCVYIAPNGIFILVDGKFLQINILCSDERGVFVPFEEMSRQFVWCPICEHWYDPDQPHECG